MNRTAIGDLLCLTVAAPLVRAVRARRVHRATALGRDVQRIDRLLRAMVLTHPHVEW